MTKKERTTRTAGLYARGIAYRARLACREVLPLNRTRDYRRFLIFGSGRSGTTMLLQRCNSHPEIACFGEVLHPDRIYWYRRFLHPEMPGFRAERDRDPLAFLDRHVWHAHPRRTRAVGFKLLHPQMMAHRRALQPLIADTGGLSVIFLRRRNVFDIYLSMKNFERRDEHGRPYRHGTKTPPPLVVDPQECRTFFRNFALNDALAERLFAGHRVLNLFYEDIVADPLAENARICDFLGVANLPLHHDLRKLSRGRLSDKVANLQEVQRHFSGAEWEWMVADEPA